MSTHRKLQILAKAGILAAALWQPQATSAALQSLCAEVRIEIAQQLTLERQAFDAHMRIHNALTHVRLEQMAVTVNFTDADGVRVQATSDPRDTNALFFITLDTISGITDVSGGGTVEPASSADIHWLIIPAPGAGGPSAAGLRYAVGATLRYTLGGERYDIEVAPDTIFVKPMPELGLDYFLPSQVGGDDAFTPEVEPPIPFALGVRVRNDGYGTARNLRIESGQPRITRNDLGLLVGFAITGAEVNGRSQAGSLLANFGDIAPGAAGTARWVMECSLSGTFQDFNASLSHADELGGELTSLLRSVRTHLLVRDVLVDLPGRDAIRDFLALDGTSYRVYESDNADTPVSNRSAHAVLTLLGSSGINRTYSLALPALAAPFYVIRPVTNSDTLTLLAAVRADGKRLPSANVWFSKTRERGTDPWQHALNLFDVNGGGTYTIQIKDATAVNVPPVLAYIGNKMTRVGDAGGLGFLVTASDDNGTVPALFTTPLPPGATFATATNHGLAEGTFLWQPQAGQNGLWPVKFTASDGALTDEELVKLYVGRQGESTNALGIPVSLAGWTARATNVIADTASSTALVQWASVPGIAYDVYGSDARYGSASNAWTRLASNVVAAEYSGQWGDATLGTNRSWRLYQVTLAGELAGSNQVWGVQRVPIKGQSWGFMAPPFRADRGLDGALGQALAASLAGDNGGPCDGVGDELYALEPDGAWRVIWLDGDSAWREADGQPAARPVPDGAGLVLLRNRVNGGTATFTGQVGNDRTRQVNVRGGWNLLALSEGKDLALAQAFIAAGGGGPAGNVQQSQADQIVMWDETGNGYWLMFARGWGAPYDGKWVDLATMQMPSLTIRPGQVIYYYRQPSAGNMPVTY